MPGGTTRTSGAAALPTCRWRRPRSRLPAREVDVIALDRALERLAALDPTQARVVELRYFGGLTLEEAADVLGTSRATVVRAFRVARAWLERELSAA